MLSSAISILSWTVKNRITGESHHAESGWGRKKKAEKLFQKLAFLNLHRIRAGRQPGKRI
jgi:hypothetical protein